MNVPPLTGIFVEMSEYFKLPFILHPRDSLPIALGAVKFANLLLADHIIIYDLFSIYAPISTLVAHPQIKLYKSYADGCKVLKLRIHRAPRVRTLMLFCSYFSIGPVLNVFD